MANYTKPPFNNVPFSFGAGGYSAPDFNDISFRFKDKTIVSTYSGLSSEIFGYTDYVKHCPTYVIGYGTYGIQIIKGRCIYGGIRNLGGYISGIRKKGTSDIGGQISGSYLYEEFDLSALINGFMKNDLPFFIGGHYPIDFGAVINAMSFSDIGASVNPIPGRDLRAFIKTPPYGDLPGDIYGWGEESLSAVVNVVFGNDLQAFIGAHDPSNLKALLRGWAREVPSDLPGFMRGMYYSELGSEIRATYLSNMSAFLNPVVPSNLTAYLRGWDVDNLAAIIDGVRLDTDLLVYIVGTGWRSDLSSYIKGVISTEVPFNLSSTISCFRTLDLLSYINTVQPVDLGGTISAVGGSHSLGGEIYPKRIRLSALISIITMCKSDLGAIINVCHKSDSNNLLSYINGIEKYDLQGIIIPVLGMIESKDLGAYIGIDNYCLAIDKLPLSVYINYRDEYWVEDRLRILMRVNSGRSSLGANLTGILTSSNLGAYIGGVFQRPVGFENSRSRRNVEYLNYFGERLKFEVAEISFESIVHDYFYNSGDNEVYKIDRLEKWVTNVKSYIPFDKRLGIKRRFHKMTKLYDISKFDTLDAAMKFAIHYVTEYPEEDLGASITAIN